MVYWPVVLCSIDLQLILACGARQKKVGANLWKSWYLKPWWRLQDRVSLLGVETAPRDFHEELCAEWPWQGAKCPHKRNMKHFQFIFNLAPLGTKNVTCKQNPRTSVLSLLIVHFFYLLFASQVPYVVSHVLACVPRNALACTYSTIHTYTSVYIFNLWRGFSELCLTKGITILFLLDYLS